MINTYELNNKIFLQGNFKGKYQAKSSFQVSNANFSNIEIVEGKIEEAEICNFSQLLNISQEALFHKNLINIKVFLKENPLNDEDIFLEEFQDTSLYNIKLSKQIEDGDTTFGVIKANMICSLDDTFQCNIIDEKSYDITKEIDFNDPWWYKERRFSPHKNSNFFTKILDRIKNIFN